MKKIQADLTGTYKFRRILSIACIAGAVVLTGTAAACTSNTASTTQSSTAAADTADTAASVTETETASAGSTDTATTSGTADSTTVTGTTDNTGAISLEDAKAIALADAGLTAADVTYTAERQDYDNGTAVYEIDFYTASTEYDYEIRVSDGAILEKSTEAFQADSSGTADTSGTASDSYISTEDAKSIALSQAGLSASDVTFRKAMLERDDGIMVYDIEFYYGRTEYEIVVNAVTGAIMEYDADTD
ncbi:MAG: PepSY domain-containing protein [Lachnospiraceae bacterium]|nr:PepSY domain-containing protein [Lachnospiraceae bacterium]